MLISPDSVVYASNNTVNTTTCSPAVDWRRLLTDESFSNGSASPWKALTGSRGLVGVTGGGDVKEHNKVTQGRVDLKLRMLYVSVWQWKMTFNCRLYLCSFIIPRICDDLKTTNAVRCQNADMGDVDLWASYKHKFLSHAWVLHCSTTYLLVFITATCANTCPSPPYHIRTHTCTHKLIPLFSLYTVCVVTSYIVFAWNTLLHIFWFWCGVWDNDWSIYARY